LGKHARKFTEVVSEIIHRPGKKNVPAYYLSQQPLLSAPADEGSNTGIEVDTQIAHISSKLDTVSVLLHQEPTELVSMRDGNIFSQQQLEDEELLPIMIYLLEGTLPADKKVATEITLQFIVVDKYFIVLGTNQTICQE